MNRSQEKALALEGDLRALPDYRALEHVVLENGDVKATDTAAHPGTVTPHGGGDARLEAGTLTAALPKLSWNVIRLAKR